MPWVERWTPGAPVNEDGSHAGSWVEYVPDKIDDYLTDPYTGVATPQQEAARMLLRGAGMQPGSYNQGAGIGKSAIEQLYASDPRFAQFFPDRNAVYQDIQGLMDKQAGIDAGVGDDFDFGNLIGAGLGAGVGYLSGGFGLGSLMNSFGGSGVQGGGMSDWFSNLFTDSPVADWADTWGDIGGLPSSGGSLMPAAIPETPQQLMEWGLQEVSPGVWAQPAMPDLSMSASDWFKAILGAVGNLLGGAGGVGGLGGSGLFGSLFGSDSRIGSILDKGAAVAPVLAAINYAKNQDPFDTSRLTGLYDSYDPKALSYEYDQNTLRGRDQLTTSLQNRGVLGSSFGNMDMTNFNTTRELGRNSLINQGIGQRAQIAQNILGADVKSRQLKNQLYGSSLLALGNVFGGRSSPTVNFGGF